MSIAEKDIECQLAEPVMGYAQPQLTRILVLAQGDALLAQLTEQMASDAAVQGRSLRGTLNDLVNMENQPWEKLDFIVFEVSDLAQDLRALEFLSAHNLQCVAISGKSISADAKTRLLDAGAAEVLIVPVQDAKTPKPLSEEAPDHSTHIAGNLSVVLRARGGAGATTVAVNLALGIAARAEAGKTALIDLDLQNGSVGLCLDLADCPEMTSLLKGEITADAAFLDKAMQTHSSGLDVLTAPDVFAPLTAVTAQDIAALLDLLSERYDNIVLDMPQAIVDWQEPALARAGRVLVVTDMSVPSIKRTRRLIDLITEEHMTLPVETVVNFEKRPRFASQTHKEAARLIGRALTHWIPEDTRAARRATDMGVPLLIGAKRSSAAKAIAGLAQTVLESRRKG